MPRVKTLKVRTWFGLQEVPEDIYADPAVTEVLRLATADTALDAIHREGYEERGEPETSIERLPFPYVDEVTGQLIVAMIKVKVKCVFVLEPQPAQ